MTRVGWGATRRVAPSLFDGVSDQGELAGLTDHDIASICLDVTPSDTPIDGQAVAQG